MTQQLSFYFSILQDINGFIKQSLDGKKDKDTIKQRIYINKKIGFYIEEVTESINSYISLMSEFANLMIDNYIDDKKQKKTVKKLVNHYGKEIDRKWKK